MTRENKWVINSAVQQNGFVHELYI